MRTRSREIEDIVKSCRRRLIAENKHTLKAILCSNLSILEEAD
jgi:hypothetical protein